MKASDLFIRALENEGVKYIFGIPGEENLDFLESLKSSSIQLILTRHEQGAGFMAATYGRLTGKIGISLATLGPGATNLVTPAAYANLGAMPMMMITGQKPIKKSKQGHFQIVDVVEMMRPLTKYTNQIIHGNNIPSKIREAVRLAEEERPGAVHIELPEDIAREICDKDAINNIIQTQKVRRPAAEKKAITLAIEKIQKAKSPLILLGAGANRNIISRMAKKLLEKTQIPFFNTQMGKGVVAEDDPLFLGTSALSSGDFLHCSIDKADLIINIGHDVIEKPPFFMEHGGKEVIHINYLPAVIDEIYFPQLQVIGDIGNSLWQISESIQAQNHWDFSYYYKIQKALKAHISEKAESDLFPVIPQRLVHSVRKIMPRDGILTLDNGIYKIWFARNYPSYEKNTLLLDNALATMGAGLPSAIGAKIVEPQKKVVTICGDGGFMMNSQEIETAIRLELDLVIIVLNDSGYGMIKWKQAGMGLSNYGLDFKNPDFVKYAEAYGATGHRIKNINELEETLEKCIFGKGVHLIDIPVDYSENEKLLTDELAKNIKSL